MRVANPIYDVVFKYLMEDKESAVLLLSKLIEEEIADLEFHPQERTVEISKETRSITVYRLDFVAKIRLEDGTYKKVIIEIQKAKFSTDIMRFRRYLGEQYRNKENVYYDEEGVKKALPIISIYFLGHKLRNIDCAVVKVKRDYYDGITGEKISEKEEFIESLTHDSFVVQIARLKQPYKSEIEQLLSIFDQNRRVTDDHLLEIDESLYPEKYGVLIRRLLRAASDQKVVDTMNVEDDILEELENMERAIEKKDKMIQEKNDVIEKKNKTIQDKDKAIQDKDNIIMELRKRLEEK